MNKSKWLLIVLALTVPAVVFITPEEAVKPPPFCLSTDAHRILRPGGTPFLWLADDAWALINRANESEVATYLDARKRQGFSVIHTWASASWMATNTDGEALLTETPSSSETVSLNRAYWKHAGRVVDMAGERQLFLNRRHETAVSI